MAAPGSTRGRAARRGERGLTMVELLVSMALVGLLVAMVFSIFTNMSLAYRTQAQVGELQQTLVAAQNLVLADVRQAGQRVPNGFTAPWDGMVHVPVEIVDDANGPDELHVYYADAAAEARVVSLLGDQLTVVPQVFEVGDVIVLSDPRDPPNVDPVPAQEYDACVVRAVAVGGSTVTVDTSAPWGTASLSHCLAVATALASPPADTMAYRFVMRGYRIDPLRKELAVLQRSATAGLVDDWEDLGIGFTDLQVASRWYEAGDVVDVDGDGDPELDWYSGAEQEVKSAPGFTGGTPLDVTVSFVIRTTKRVAGITTAATPQLLDPASPDHNPIGNRDAVQLEGVADSARPDELRGDHVYRWSTTRADLRNLEVVR
ncbi:MAG: prepilin-type N-terminal cleavage/methylation domain-containing protein [Kofleriaceae bacterium]|nr:prepilin-type N-terminal cleavage/methylation domain-containing protein [Myxococcales bacterium]MCB9564912.1 prepilin-type N-terminal cleavage/methylation domain-containing protein [Kofleriaceae bacterium]